MDWGLPLADRARMTHIYEGMSWRLPVGSLFFLSLLSLLCVSFFLPLGVSSCGVLGSLHLISFILSLTNSISAHSCLQL